MTEALPCQSGEVKAEIAALFENPPPVLVEVRFPGAATAPDWYLLTDEEQWEQLVDRLGSGAELHASSVWDLRNVKKPLCFKRLFGKAWQL